ncbi:MAG: hypothetical protein SFW65_00910 [Alphaproteobacteria bacterium]|nr:hypothetical protein [Alphaproteobacteria bacterium]
MGVEKAKDLPVVRTWYHRLLIGTGKVIGKTLGYGALAVSAIYGAWRYGGTSPEDRKRQTEIDQVNQKKEQDDLIRTDEGVNTLREQEARRLQAITRSREIEREIRDANPTLSDDDIKRMVRERIAAEQSTPTGTLGTPSSTPSSTATLSRTQIWPNDVCEANGLAPLSAPSGAPFSGLEVKCEGATIAPNGTATDQATVIVNTYRRQGGVIVTASGRPVIESSFPLTAQITANGQAVTLPSTASLAAADTLIVQIKDPADPSKTVPSEIRVGQNRDQMQRFRTP